MHIFSPQARGISRGGTKARKLCSDKEIRLLPGSGIAPPEAGYSVWRRKGSGRGSKARSFLVRAPNDPLHNTGLDDPHGADFRPQTSCRVSGNCAAAANGRADRSDCPTVES